MPEEQSFFLFGPRGTGKSTLLRAALPQAFYLDLLDLGVYSELLAHPHRLEAMASPHMPATIVLDEIQRLPLLLYEGERIMGIVVEAQLLSDERKRQRASTAAPGTAR